MAVPVLIGMLPVPGAAASRPWTFLKNAETSLQGLHDDLEFLREQITVMEVNTARLYNWDVVRRRERLGCT